MFIQAVARYNGFTANPYYTFFYEQYIVAVTVVLGLLAFARATYYLMRRFRRGFWFSQMAAIPITSVIGYLIVAFDKESHYHILTDKK